MVLPSLISLRRLNDAPLDPEDIFGSSLGGIFTDDAQNLHGDDLDTVIVYKNAKHGDLEFRTADVSGEEQRRKFAHYLWNASILMAEFIGGRADCVDENTRGSGVYPDLGDTWKEEKWWTSAEDEKLWSVEAQTILELGAGVGLGGVMSTLAGAREVVVTDYPAPPILDAIKKNVSKNIPEHLRDNVTVQGHLWGDFSSDFAIAHAHRYTRILAADCLWMPGEHENLAQSMLHFLAETPDARIFCIAGFHTGRAKVAPFFEEVIPQIGLEIEDIYEMNVHGVCRSWAKERDGGTEDIGERKKWLVIARIRRCTATRCP